MVIIVIDPLSISPAQLPDAQRTKDYAQTLTVSGGVPPYQWTIPFGALPTSLGLNPQADTSKCDISGNVNAPPSTYNFTVRVTDANGNVVEA